MGWTGIYNWYRCESNKDILNREFFSHNEKSEPLAWAERGAHTWLLWKVKETGKVYASVTLTQRCRDGEFMYKEMGLSSGPYLYDIPKSWLSKIDKDYLEEDFCKAWLERYKEYAEKQKSSKGDFPVWKTLKNNQKLTMVIQRDCSLGSKGETVNGYWSEYSQSIIAGGYRTNKGRAKLFFESVKVAEDGC